MRTRFVENRVSIADAYPVTGACDWSGSSAYVHTARPEKLETKTFLLANLLKNRLTLFPLPFELNHCRFFFFFSYIVRILFSLFLPDLYLTAIRYTRYTVPWKGETKVDLSFISTVSKIVERVETLDGFSYKIF